MKVSRLNDRDRLAAFLSQERVLNAYLLGYLDPDYVDFCRWYVATEGDEIRTIALLYQGLSLPALFTAGDSDGLAEIVDSRDNDLPERLLIHVPEKHVPTLRRRFDARGPLRKMTRMGLSRDEWEDPDADGASVERLSHMDTAAIVQIYRHFPDHFFEPYQLESGLYFGIRAEDGSLASIAGIHAVSAQFNIAAIGNLVTRPDQRGEGYATKCTARLLRETFERVKLVTLDVEVDNEPAVRTYRRFGFLPYGVFFEGEMQRKG